MLQRVHGQDITKHSDTQPDSLVDKDPARHGWTEAAAYKTAMRLTSQLSGVSVGKVHGCDGCRVTACQSLLSAKCEQAWKGQAVDARHGFRI